MPRRPVPVAATCLTALAVWTAPGPAAAEIYVAEVAGGSVIDAEAGGDLTGATRFATGLAGPFDICLGPVNDIYVSEFFDDEVTIVTDGGDFTGSTPFATGLSTPVALHCTQTRVLVVELTTGEITDITAGGDFTDAPAFAFGFTGGTVVEIFGDSGGTLYAASQSLGQIFDITSGGDFSSAMPIATGGTTPRHMTETAQGVLLAANQGVQTVNIFTGGGDMSGSVFASGVPINGLFATDTRVLAAASTLGSLYDISAGGDILALTPLATGLETTGGGFVGILEIPLVCGNGITQAGEDCDDAGESSICNADCSTAMCGDGVLNVTAGETCDDMGESATCNMNCSAASCGDGIVNTTAGETCDDSGRSEDCNDDCTAATCGDGIINAAAGEECDGDGAGTPGETVACDEDCTGTLCGDMTVNVTAGEECDDGNTDDGDGCSATCRLEESGETDGTSTGPDASTTDPFGTSTSDPSSSTTGDTSISNTDGAAGGASSDDGCSCSTREQGHRGSLWSMVLLGFGALRRRYAISLR